MSEQETAKLVKKVAIDLETLPGTLSAMLVNPANMTKLANMGMAFAQFLSRDIPAHAFAAHMKGFLKGIADYQQAAEDNQQAVNAVLAASADSVTPTGRDTAVEEKEQSSGQGVAESAADSGA